MKRVMDHGDFLVLSAAIHYQLMGRPPNLDTVLALVLDEQGLTDEDSVRRWISEDSNAEVEHYRFYTRKA